MKNFKNKTFTFDLNDWEDKEEITFSIKQLVDWEFNGINNPYFKCSYSNEEKVALIEALINDLKEYKDEIVK